LSSSLAPDIGLKRSSGDGSFDVASQICPARSAPIAVGLENGRPGSRTLTAPAATTPLETNASASQVAITVVLSGRTTGIHTRFDGSTVIPRPEYWRTAGPEYPEGPERSTRVHVRVIGS
jgi:hypothetical protein